MHWGSHVEVSNSQRISCLDSSLGRVPAYYAGDPGLIPGGGKLYVCLQGALLEDRDDPGQVSLYWVILVASICLSIILINTTSHVSDPFLAG